LIHIHFSDFVKLGEPFSGGFPHGAFVGVRALFITQKFDVRSIPIANAAIS